MRMIFCEMFGGRRGRKWEWGSEQNEWNEDELYHHHHTTPHLLTRYFYCLQQHIFHVTPLQIIMMSMMRMFCSLLLFFSWYIYWRSFSVCHVSKDSVRLILDFFISLFGFLLLFCVLQLWILMYLYSVSRAILLMKEKIRRSIWTNGKRRITPSDHHHHQQHNHRPLSSSASWFDLYLLMSSASSETIPFPIFVPRIRI